MFCVRTFRLGINRCAGNTGSVGSIPIGIKDLFSLEGHFRRTSASDGQFLQRRPSDKTKRH